MLPGRRRLGLLVECSKGGRTASQQQLNKGVAEPGALLLANSKHQTLPDFIFFFL